MKFPQDIFVKKLSSVLETQSFTELIDAPCGDGYVTQHLAQKFFPTKVKGADWHSHSSWKTSENVFFEQVEIHQFVDDQQDIQIFCLVNSLFLLPEPELLLEKIYLKLCKNGQLLLIVPNVESKNFQNFQSIEPQINVFTPTLNDLTALLQKIGFEIVTIEPIVFTHFFGRWDTKILFFIKHRYLSMLEFFNERKTDKTNAYFLYQLRKGGVKK
jgi:SAM-dependent methyltransferase